MSQSNAAEISMCHACGVAHAPKSYYHRGSASASETPQRAPADYASMGPNRVDQTHSYGSRWVSAGEPTQSPCARDGCGNVEGNVKIFMDESAGLNGVNECSEIKCARCGWFTLYSWRDEF